MTKGQTKETPSENPKDIVVLATLSELSRYPTVILRFGLSLSA